MATIHQIDPNFEVKTKVKQEGLVFRNCLEIPFSIHGLMREGDRFCRLPFETAKNISLPVSWLYANTAGGRVRFRTDSPYVAIHAEFGTLGRFPHFAFSGSAGFDLYADGCYQGTFMPPIDLEGGYESIVNLDGGMHEITVNFPLYSEVKELFIGLDENASLFSPKEYAVKDPVVYYGSSITQGGCASKPGSTYQSILSNRLDCDYMNFGFSGNAKGEPAMAEYLASLSMSAFVLDYDHNAPTHAHLEETHGRFFEIMRKAHPNLPILMMTRPVYFRGEWELGFERIVQNTYETARAAGDENVYLLTGDQLMALVQDNGTVDNVHPTDSGFLSMANAIEPVLRKMLGR
ncbi:MAG: hypothetical protein IJC88_06615 [Oscillospiraceae bacterium]|nr:hypothetical protein [Oscillospiraceae bacterium]